MLKSSIAALSLGLAGLMGLTLAPLLDANSPHASQIVSVSGDRLQFQRGTQRPQQARVGQRLQNQSESLIVPGNKSALARLAFLGGGQSYGGLILQAGPDAQQTKYSFPCILSNGRVTLSWRQGSNRGCESGIRLGNSVSVGPKQQHKPSAQAKQMAAPSESSTRDQPVAVVPAESNITVKPSGTEPILLRIIVEAELQAIETLEGSIILTSDKYPDGLILNAGERYFNLIDGQDLVEPFDPEAAIATSPELTDFLDPETWQGPFAEDIEDHLIALADPGRTIATAPDDFSDLSLSCQLDVDYYLANLKTSMGNSWLPPYPPSTGVWRTEVTYLLTKAGQIQDLQITKSSGHGPLDEAALTHVRAFSTLFEPFPSCYPYEAMPVDNNFTVRYF